MSRCTVIFLLVSGLVLSFSSIATSTTLLASNMPEIKAVKEGVDPFPEELLVMEKHRSAPSQQTVEELAALRYKIGNFLLHKKTEFSGESLELALLYAESAATLVPTEASYWGLLWQAAEKMASEQNFYPAKIVALNAMEQVLALKPDDFSVHLAMATSLAGQQDWKGALHHFEKALELEPSVLSPALIQMMNTCYLAAPQTRRGIDLYLKHLTQTPQLDYLRFSTAILFKAQQNSMAAEKMVLEVIARPDSSQQNKDYAKKLLSFWNAEMLAELEEGLQ
jgi:tetratricopeptide (TPR) repeat protein